MSHTHLIALHKSCHRTQPPVFTDPECTRVAACAGAYTHTHAATCSHTGMCAHTLYEKESDNDRNHPDVHPGGRIYTTAVWDFWEWNKQQREPQGSKWDGWDTAVKQRIENQAPLSLPGMHRDLETGRDRQRNLMGQWDAAEAAAAGI